VACWHLICIVRPEHATVGWPFGVAPVAAWLRCQVDGFSRSHAAEFLIAFEVPVALNVRKPRPATGFNGKDYFDEHDVR